MKISFKASVLLLSALVAGKLTAKAQTSNTTPGGIKYSVGVETGLGIGNFKDTHKANIGGSIQADIPVANRWYATVNAGYVNYFGKDNVLGTGINAKDLHLLPVMAGIKYMPYGNWYILADAGAAFALNKNDLGFDKTAAFLYVPQIGYELPLPGKSRIDIGARYEGTTSFNSNSSYAKVNQLGLRIAYGFGL